MGKQDFLYDISVIIYTKNNASNLNNCLSALRKQTLDGGQFEVLVVDDGSTDTTRSVLKQHTQHTHWTPLRQNPMGLAYAYNRALQAAQGEFVLFLCDDTSPEPDAIAQHLSTHRTRPERQLCVQGRHRHTGIDTFNTYLEDTGAFISGHQTLPMAYMTPRETHPFNLSVAIDALSAIDGFDERLTHDHAVLMDCCFRLADIGYRTIYAPNATVESTQSYTIDDLESLHTDWAEAWVEVFERHPGRVREWGDLRYASIHQLADTVETYGPEVAERKSIITRLNAFDLADEALCQPETQRRLLNTIDEQYEVLKAYWWANGFMEGLKQSGLSSFSDLLKRRGRTEDLVPQRTVLFMDSTPTAEDMQTLYHWSRQHDEHTAGGLIVALQQDPTVKTLDPIATQIACMITRAHPRTNPAAMRLLMRDDSPEQIEAFFIGSDQWLARDRVWERTLAELAARQGCAVEWLSDTDLVHSAQLPGTIRIGIWPDWDNYTDLLTLIDKWWPALSARSDCALVLFHSKDQASRAKRSAQTLQELLDQSANGDHTAHVTTATVPRREPEQAYWRQNLDGMIQLPSDYSETRLNWLEDLGCRTFFNAIELERHLVNLHLLTDQLLGHAPLEAYYEPYPEVHEQIS